MPGMLLFKRSWWFGWFREAANFVLYIWLSGNKNCCLFPANIGHENVLVPRLTVS